MSRTRIQLTLFVPEAQSGLLEAVRQAFNPEQFALIRAHVTLCREDELEQFDAVFANLIQLKSGAIPIHFGAPVRFSEGEGVLLPAVGANEPFHALRARVLQGVIDPPRQHEPHITLMHPRNSTCTDEFFEKITQFEFPVQIEFDRISLIRQEIGRPWSVLQTFQLHP